MKPNIFEYGRYTAEDFFSRSLAYIATTFPSIGQNLIQRIAVSAGKPPMFFGSFESCTFVGHTVLKPHFTSKPDLKITCSKRTIYFENKLETPMSFDQLLRQADPMCLNPKWNLIFVSNIQHQNAALRSLPGYLHPRDADHYLWVDLMPAFESNFKKKSLGANILEDFRTALKANGMIGRTIKDAKALPPESQRSLRNTRTDLDKFSPTEITALIAHGYSCARKTLIEAHLLTEGAPPFSWDPLRNWQIVKSHNATRQLRQSCIRRWRLWSSRDWASYAILGLVLAPLIYMGYLAYLPFKATQIIREVSVPRLVENIKVKEATIPFDSRNVFQAMSLTSFDRINVTFRNAAGQSAELYWIDLNGSAKLITTIRSGDSATVETFVGHLWSAKTRNGESLGTYVVEGA